MGVRVTRIAIHRSLLLAARQVLIRLTSNTEHANDVLGIAHLRALALSSVFAGVATGLTELTAIAGMPPIGADKEEEAGQPRELVWLVDLSGQVVPSNWHPRQVLRELDIEEEAG